MYTRNFKTTRQLSHHATLLPSQSITPNKLNIVRQQIAQAIDETQNILKKSETETRKKLHDKYKEHYSDKLNQSLRNQKQIYDNEHRDYTNKVKAEYKKQVEIFNTRIENLVQELNQYKNTRKKDPPTKKRKSKPTVKKLGKRPRFESDIEETEEEDDENEEQ